MRFGSSPPDWRPSTGVLVDLGSGRKRMEATGVLNALGVRDLRDLYSAGAATVSDVVSEICARAGEVNGAIGAVRWVAGEGARESARLSDARFDQGRPRALEGIPFTAKCVLTPCWQVPRTGGGGYADVVSALIDAGAILVGVTEASHFAVAAEPDRPLSLVRNPRLWGRTAGDSSDGAASAVAAGLGPIALGTDTTGSVRSPAALCGVAGLKPTHGSVSTLGSARISEYLDDIGFVGRSVSDLRELYRVAIRCCAGSSRDLMSDFSRVRWGRRSPRGDRLRWGVLSDEALSATELPATPVFDSAVGALASAGEVVVDVPTTCVADCLESARLLVGAGVVEEVRRAVESGSPPLTAMTLARAALASDITTKDLAEATAARRSAIRAFDAALDLCDVLLLPSNGCVAPTHREYERYSLGSSSGGISPVSPFNRVASVTGLPAMTLPVGAGESDLPIGLQVLAPWGAEELLFDAGAFLEGIFGTGQDRWGVDVRGAAGLSCRACGLDRSDGM